MDEFLNDEQRDSHVAALQTELQYLHQSGKREDDVKAIEKELKRLGADATTAAAPTEPTVELDGEFGSLELRDAHIAALKDELRGAESVGDKSRVAAVKGELKRLAGKPAKTKAELDAEAAAAAEQTTEIDGALA